MFETCLHHEEPKWLLPSCSGFFIDDLDHVHNWVGAVSNCKTSWKKLCECETSVTIVCMSCDNVAISKKYKVRYIYIYIYIAYIHMQLYIHIQ